MSRLCTRILLPVKASEKTPRGEELLRKVSVKYRKTALITAVINILRCGHMCFSHYDRFHYGGVTMSTFFFI
jgi:hypothetical protein